MSAALKKKVESTAKYYGNAARKSDARAGFAMSPHEISDYARDKFEDNFRGAAESKYKAHFMAALRSAYLGKPDSPTTKKSKPPLKFSKKAKQPLKFSKERPVKASELKRRACSSRFLPAALRKRYC